MYETVTKVNGQARELPEIATTTRGLAESRAAVGRAWGRVQADRWAAVTSLGPGDYLDVGCSGGAYVRRLGDLEQLAFGVDLLRDAAWRDDGRFLCADAGALPLADRSVDVAFAFEVLEHVPDPLNVVRELARIARRAVVVSVPDCETPRELAGSGLAFNHWTDRSHVQFFTTASLGDLLKSAGLTVQPIRRINPVSPERVMLRAWGWPERVAAPAARCLSRLPGRRPLTMTLLATCEVQPPVG